MSETVYICPRCYGRLKMPDELPGIATCEDCRSFIAVQGQAPDICWYELLHTLDWEPPVEDFTEAVLSSTMTDGQKLYWLVESWRKAKARIAELEAERAGLMDIVDRVHSRA